MFHGVSFMYEFDSKDWLCGMWRNCLFNSKKYELMSLQNNGPETYDAYAPLPMVLDIIRKGKSLGKGSNCDCIGQSIVSISVPAT